MKRLQPLTMFLMLIIAGITFPAFAQKQPANDLDKLFEGKAVFIAAHRGDWRNAPENSLQGLKNCIAWGIDIVEIDLKKTSDGQLVIMHDETIDRTTNGKGKVADYTLEQLQKFWLINGNGHITTHRIPTLEEYLSIAKGNITICVDKGFEYVDQALAMIRQKNMQGQIIYNIPPITLDSLNQRYPAFHLDGIALNILVDIRKADVKDVITSYKYRKHTLIHPTFSSDKADFVKWMPEIRKMGLSIWLNALWPEHNGGHDDDMAVEQSKPDQAWGWLIAKGANVIQTDRPKELLLYLKSIKHHH
ncbi:glycerophosphodiester phosphodiesterase family protein [Pedobacter sp. N23S346]|uniref:glycerophosphodiester phosphodiesterase family protein n=1 Tax=Pedobacter sp. N23S346 TaxID=3402750 RepID=UPI003AC6C2F1